MGQLPMKISVVVPTYRRPRDLERCLAALSAQHRVADEILVVHRLQDDETHAVLAEPGWRALEIKAVIVAKGGQVAALNCGLDAATGDIIAITDDDAAPRPDWLLRIEKLFSADPLIVGVGGRDFVYENGALLDGAQAVVGKVQWWGRCVGNHHLGVGPPREVDLLKGANMSFRRSGLGDLKFDERLRGEGAQVGNDWKIALSLRRAGGKLIYDPAVAVDHYPAVRHDAHKRDGVAAIAEYDKAHNVFLALLEFLPAWRKPVFVVWSLLLGTRDVPGVLQAPRLWRLGLDSVGTRVTASLGGQLRGVRTWLDSR